MGKHLLLGRREVVGAKIAEMRYMSSFILKTLPWVVMACSESARADVFGMDSNPGNKRGNNAFSILLLTSYGTLISPCGTPRVQNTDSSSNGSLPCTGITNYLEAGS